MVRSRAPISRMTRITGPFAASAACAASVTIAAPAAPISASDSQPRSRSREAADTSGWRHWV